MKQCILDTEAVIPGKVINLAVGRKIVLQAKKDQFIKDIQSLEISRKGQALLKC